MDVSFLAPYPDFFAFIMIILLALLLSTGVKESTILNNIFTAINLFTVVIVIASGVIKGSCYNHARISMKIIVNVVSSFIKFIYLTFSHRIVIIKIHSLSTHFSRYKQLDDSKGKYSG